MEFEFDLGKSTSNNKKHGIDFLEAQALWDDPDFIEIPLKTVDEPRWSKYMKTKEIDRKFDEGEDITKYLDISKARRPEQEQKRANVDFPLWMIHLLDKEARRLGVPRQSIIKVWVAERLERHPE